MLRRTIILILLVSFPLMGKAQEISLIGMQKEEVKEVVKKEFRKYAQDNSIVRQQFNYLKYVNGSGTITWIIYFSDDDICTSTKKVCDYIEYDFVLDDLDEQCESTGDMKWEFTLEENTYTLTLEEKDWYFTLRERVKNNKN
ncbi:MAG: hypothetical protein PF450_09780 [Bacteroidales bacterium]|jgi:hypothetical protein|nr:hypothetical protein [Bacteroidales bacterium]